jgi:DNA repair protein RecO (recombination protein O)
MLVKGKQYDYAGSAINQESFLNIKDNLEKLAISGKSIKLFNEMIGWEEKDKFLFDFLTDYLIALEKCVINKNNLIYESFALKLLEITGYKPDFSACQNCRKKFEKNSSYFGQNKIICSDCLKLERSPYLKISPEALIVLKFIINNKFENIFKIKTDDAIKNETKVFCRLFFAI